MSAPAYSVVATAQWTRKCCAIYAGNGPIEIDGQVTHLLITVPGAGDVHAYVRENFSGTKFGEMTSNSRLGLAHRVPAERQILELACDHCWDEVARAVHAIDAIHRPVRHNAKWTTREARRVLSARKAVAA